MPFQNPWINYVDRTYEQIKQNVLQKMILFVPELTDHTENNIFVRLLSVWAGIAEMLGYYIDNIAREVYLSTARRKDSAIKIAKLFDYRIRGVVAASVDLEFSIDAPAVSDIQIPIGTSVKTSNDIQFLTTQAVTILAGESQATVSAIQQTLVPESVVGVSDATEDQVYVLDSDIVDNSVKVVVGAEEYAYVSTLAFQNSLDQVFTTSLNEENKMQVIFGNGIQGFIPPIGEDIKVTYSKSEGFAGNLAENTVIKIDSNIITPNSEQISVTNPIRTSGGADIETLADLQKNIPLSVRTLQRAVTIQDYIDIAELQPGVIRADVRYDCGRFVDVYIVPEGGGIASQQLLDEVKDAFHDETRMVLTEVNPRPAGEILVLLEINVRVNPIFDTTRTLNLVASNLKTFIGVDNQDISGTVNIGDVYQTVENTEGVGNSEVILLSLVPIARIISGTAELDWDPKLLPGSTSEIVWRIKHVNATTYELQQGQNVIGTFNYGVLQTFQEISYTINNDNYQVGDVWEFVSYRYNGSINLNEPAIPILRDANLKISLF